VVPDGWEVDGQAVKGERRKKKTLSSCSLSNSDAKSIIDSLDRQAPTNGVSMIGECQT